MNRRVGEGYGVPSGSGMYPNAGSGQGGIPPQVAPGPLPVPSMETTAATAQMLINNPMMQQYGQAVANQGQAMLDSGVSNFMARSHLKTYFAVDTNYVLQKLKIILFPFLHKDWSPRYQQQDRALPSEDINSPDLYIPVMGFVTYVLLTGVVLGTQQRFSPEQLGMTASSLLAWLLAEVLIIWLCLYLLAVHSQLRWLDLVAYSGYKYVCMIVTVICGLLLGSYGYYAVMAYTCFTIAYFVVQSLRLAVQPHVTEGASKLRNYFVLLVSLLQPVMIVWLTYGLTSYQPVQKNMNTI